MKREKLSGEKNIIYFRKTIYSTTSTSLILYTSMKHWAYTVSWPVFTTYNRCLSRRDYTWPALKSHNDDFTHLCESGLGNFSLLYHIRNYFTATLPRKKILSQKRGFEKRIRPSTFGIGNIKVFYYSQDPSITSPFKYSLHGL